jgi:hypothetical protein
MRLLLDTHIEIARDHGSIVSVDRGPEGGARFRFTTASSAVSG